MQDSQENLCARRLSFLVLLVYIISGFLAFRLFQKAVLEHSDYLARAQSQQLSEEKIQPSRGKIYSSNLANPNEAPYPLATNQQLYQISVIPKHLSNPGDVAQKLSPILDLPEKELFDMINNKKSYLPPLRKRLSKEQADQISTLKITGVYLNPEEIRFYPEGSLAAHLLGFVTFDGDGKYGLEGYFNQRLKGLSGKMIAEKDRKGRLIEVTEEKVGRSGDDFYLTVDRNIQNFIEGKLKEYLEKFQADSGSILINQPKTGKILAMAGWPNFDPNQYNTIPSNEQNRFTNPTIGYIWEPGSVFKPIAMSIAIDQGLVEPDTQEVFSNMVVVKGHEIHTAQDKAFGRETMTQVLENSDNVAMVWVQQKIDPKIYYDYLKNFGFGKKLGITLDRETSGNLVDLKDFGEVMRATIAFGQGISVTPLQMLQAVSVIANGGKLLEPHIYDKVIKANREEELISTKEIRQVIKPETANKIKEMMVSVVERGHGKKAGVPGYRIAGKTGTAQVPNSTGGYEEGKHIGSFVGFGPADDPQFAMLVKLDNPKNVEWAESSAAPLFGEIAEWLLGYFNIPPQK